MKKYFQISAYVLLYLALMYGFGFMVANLWFKLLPQKFAYSNYVLIGFIAFLLTVGVYGLIFKLRKKSFIKICRFSKLSAPNFITLVFTGLIMGTFTCFLCNTSLIVKNVPAFEKYLMDQLHGSQNFLVFLLVIAIIFAFEEMIYRGAIFNELLTGTSLYPSIIISVLIYGLINSYMSGIAIGVYASVAALFYTLAYAYTSSLFASITLQVSSIYIIMIFIKTGVWQWVRGLGDVFLTISLIIFALLVVLSYYFIYIGYKKGGVTNKASISA